MKVHLELLHFYSFMSLVMVPYQMLLLIGHNVHAVCPGKKNGETIKTAIHDFEVYLQIRYLY